MRNLALFFLFLGSYYTTKAQPNYLPYHQKMVDIEELILQEAFPEAEAAILQLFTNYKTAFADDLLLAAQLCALNGHDEHSLVFLEKALEKGAEINFIKTIPILQPLFKTAKWKHIEERLPRLRYNYAININTELSKEFKKRFIIEQEAKSTQRYEEVVKNNFDRIVEVMAAHGFPGEQLTGYYTGHITTTLLHHPYSFSLLHDELYQALKDGQLHPLDFLKIYVFEVREMGSLYQKKLHPPTGLELQRYHFLSYPDTDIPPEQVRLARYELGISFIDFGKKVQLGKKYGIRF